MASHSNYNTYSSISRAILTHMSIYMCRHGDYLLAFRSLAHFRQSGEELSNEVRGRCLVPVKALDPEAARGVTATQLAALHREQWPVGVEGVLDVLWTVRGERRVGIKI